MLSRHLSGADESDAQGCGSHWVRYDEPIQAGSQRMTRPVAACASAAWMKIVR
jgi:hypothetical protein